MSTAFQHLAYRRTILEEVIDHLLKTCTGGMGGAPQRILHSDELPKVSAEVPQESINHFINGLQQESESIRLEMAKFVYRREHEQDVQAQGNRRARRQSKKR